MKFPKLTISNFLAISEAEIALADRGLVLVQGLNNDDTSASSNGAGKSTAFEALMWCLYGTTARGDEGDSLVNRFSDKGKNCRVEVEIEDNNALWVVARHRKHKTGKNAVHLHQVDNSITGRKLIDHTQGTDKLTQAMIDKILGCPQEVFVAAMYAGQNKMPELAAMTDKKLKMLVEEAAGTTILESAYEEARARARIKVDELAGFNKRIDYTADLINDRGASIIDLGARSTAWIAARDQAAKNLEAIGDDFSREAFDLTKKISAYDGAKLQKVVDDCDARIKAAAGERTQEMVYAKQLGDAESDVKLLSAKFTRLVGEAKAAKVAFDAIDHSIGCPCSECDRPLTAAEVAPQKKIGRERLQKLVADVRTTKADLEARTSVRDALADTLGKHRASMTDLTATAAQRASQEALLRELAALQAQRQNKLASAKHHHDAAAAKATEKDPHDAQIASQKASRNSLMKELKQLEERRDEIQIEAEVAESVVKVFSPGGVRAHILDTVTPFLNDQTAKYLSVLSDGNITASWTTLTKNSKGELKEKFVIEVEKGSGGDSFTLISGGEQRKVSIAAALALQDLVASRATKPIELFVGDEIDNALDPAGIERLMVILEEKARERGSVFIISHSDLKDWCSQVMTVTRENKVSTIEEATV